MYERCVVEDSCRKVALGERAVEGRRGCVKYGEGGFAHLEADSYTSNICAVLCARGALVILRRQKRPHRLQGSPDTTCYALLPDRSTYQFIKSYSLFNIQKPLAISDNC